MYYSKHCWAALLLAFCIINPSSSAVAVDVIVGDDVLKIESTLADVQDLWVTSADFTRINGFEIKPQGACFQDLCIPLKQDSDSELFVKRQGQAWFNASKFADKIQQAFVVDQQSQVWSFGMVPTARKSFLESAIAPDFELDDRNGDLIRLSDFRGKKVLILTWASW